MKLRQQTWQEKHKQRRCVVSDIYDDNLDYARIEQNRLDQIATIKRNLGKLKWHFCETFINDDIPDYIHDIDRFIKELCLVLPEFKCLDQALALQLLPSAIQMWRQFYGIQY